MRHLPIAAAVALIALLAPAAAAQQPARDTVPRGALATGTLAITNVHVLPMTSDTVLRAQTVLVRDGRIIEIGPVATVRVPEGTVRVDGRGRWLMPGLVDLHTHLYSDDAVPDSLAADELGVMLANGVTTARLMIGTPEHLALRRDIAAGRLLGPQLWVASPQFTGREGTNARVVTTADEARAAVREVAAAGYDQVKLTTALTAPVYDAIVEEAARHGLRVVGHVEGGVTLARALQTGQQLEHLDGYFEAALADIANTTRIAGVMVGGRWLERAELDAMVERATRTIGSPIP